MAGWSSIHERDPFARTDPGWELSQARYDRDRLQVLKDRIAHNEYKEIRSIIVIQDGKLLVEPARGGPGPALKDSTP